MRMWMNATLVVGLVVGIFASGCGSEPAQDLGGTKKTTSKKDGGASTGDTADNGGDTTSGIPTGFSSFHPDGPSKAYFSGYDGTNSYVIPVAFYAEENPTVTFGDPSIAEMSGSIINVTKQLAPSLPDELEGKMKVIMVKSKKAGTTTIHAVAGSVDQTANLTVTSYAASDVAVGQHRYEQGTPACVSCHASLKVHSTSMLADLSDDTILGIAVDGNSVRQINVESGKIDTLQPNDGNHHWNVTTEERKGLMAYLRSRDLTFQLPMGF